MKTISVLGMLLIVVCAKAQYASDHYHPQKIIAELGLRQLKIYKGHKSDSTLLETWEYDEKGNEIAHIDHKYGTKTTYAYNEGNQLVKSVWKPDGYGISTTDTFIYSDGLLIQKRSFDENGDEKFKVKYAYKKGLLMKEEYSSKKGRSTETRYSYSKEGWLETRNTYEGKSLIRTGEWTRDKEGRMIGYKGKTIGRAHVVLQEYVYNADGLEMEHSALNYESKLKTQLYLREYTKQKLLVSIDRYTGIVGGDLQNAHYEKRVYVYE